MASRYRVGMMPDVGPFWVLPVESSEGTLVRTHDSDSDWRRPRALSTRSLQKNGNIRSHFVDLRGKLCRRPEMLAHLRQHLSGAACRDCLTACWGKRRLASPPCSQLHYL